eukprot:TRINITY_DN10699_c0_g1_i1.p2 TRINITY_DN10699_c0_g1~~TRINITY_DN10699_c0_g1_i1.p2  ORF type:complete len:201 (+),score=70.00 TRINITY_DN10699_c0_g1_i1:57-605(+)
MASQGEEARKKKRKGVKKKKMTLESNENGTQPAVEKQLREEDEAGEEEKQEIEDVAPRQVSNGQVMAEMFYENFSLTMKPMSEVLTKTAFLHEEIIKHLMANRRALDEVAAEGDEVREVFERIPAYNQKLNAICEKMKQTTERAAALKANAYKAEAMRRADLENMEQRQRNEKALEDKIAAK